MERRTFLAASGAVGLLPWAAGTVYGQAASGRELLELRVYHLDTPQQRAGFEQFAREAAIPALNRLGIKPVGVFAPADAHGPVYVLLPHKSLESVTTLLPRLAQDGEFLRRGAAFLEAPADAPSYHRVESSLLLAFQGMPRVDVPITSPGRVFQLRIYESPSEQ